MENIGITDHAIERFVERSRKLGMPPPREPEAALRKLLGIATRENIDPVHNVLRILKNNGEALYFVAEGWRFVISEDMTTLITVERVRREQN